jgi:hypothetical protein
VNFRTTQRVEWLERKEVRMKLLARGTMVALASFIVSSAYAQDVATGSGLICDTREQIERYVAMYDGNPQRTIELVNEQSNSKSACGLAQIAYQRAEEIADIRVNHARGKIVQLTIVGINYSGIWQGTRPYTQFTIFMLPGQEV